MTQRNSLSYASAKAKLSTLADRIRIAGRVAPPDIMRIEDVLGVSLPVVVFDFIATFGYIAYRGTEIYGAFSRAPLSDGATTVLGSTRLYRRFGLPHNFAVVEADGAGGAFAVSTSVPGARQQESPVYYISVGNYPNPEEEFVTFGDYLLDRLRE